MKDTEMPQPSAHSLALEMKDKIIKMNLQVKYLSYKTCPSYSSSHFGKLQGIYHTRQDRSSTKIKKKQYSKTHMLTLLKISIVNRAPVGSSTKYPNFLLHIYTHPTDKPQREI